VGGASTTVEDSDTIESGVPENGGGVGVGIMSLGALQAEIHLGGNFTPPLTMHVCKITLTIYMRVK